MKKLISLILAFLLIPMCSALTSGEGTIVFGAIFSMSIIVLFFLMLSIVINNYPMKIFFMSLAFLTLVASVGVGVSIMQEFFSSFENLVESYGQFYILLLGLTSAGMIALIIWLIVVAVKSFYSYRGIIE